MKKFTMILSASIFVLGSVLTSGCALTTAGVKKGDERNFARSLNDVSASRAIKARMGRTEGFMLKGVDVEVAEGIVVLSGNVPRPEDRVEAERIAWSAQDVIQIGNEIKIGGKQGAVRNVKDGVLNNSVRARLVAHSQVKARNYNIEVHDGVVYLLGVARTAEELALAAQIVSTTRGTREVVSYVKIAGDESRAFASGPGFKGQPSAVASLPNAPMPYVARPTAPNGAVDLPALPEANPVPRGPVPPRSNNTVLDDDAIDSGEPYYLDPLTGERVEIPEGVKPIPYVPDTPGSLGAGATPLPPGMLPSASGSIMAELPRALPSDDQLGEYRTGPAGEAVSVIESAPYTLDPETGKMVPISFINGAWTPQIIK